MSHESAASESLLDFAYEARAAYAHALNGMYFVPGGEAVQFPRQPELQPALAALAETVEGVPDDDGSPTAAQRILDRRQGVAVHSYGRGQGLNVVVTRGGQGEYTVLTSAGWKADPGWFPDYGFTKTQVNSPSEDLLGKSMKDLWTLACTDTDATLGEGQAVRSRITGEIGDFSAHDNPSRTIAGMAIAGEMTDAVNRLGKRPLPQLPKSLMRRMLGRA